ncbi:hypothetical protein BDV98DRAFT_585899 [Pterulicium gracile]|uniref:Zn(2)-C6 fungal-type domain-containing protein n=1 Tax=Pterulicium gracile TaxID=1884261 RepID=A0A5C3Q4Q2_9AGAR|nr:hypothetical protein BDV98DRAFT_585899 [Pterula gracilis]
MSEYYSSQGGQQQGLGGSTTLLNQGSSGQGHDEDEGFYIGRQRTKTACNSCKQRKIKCDALRAPTEKRKSNLSNWARPVWISSYNTEAPKTGGEIEIGARIYASTASAMIEEVAEPQLVRPHLNNQALPVDKGRRFESTWVLACSCCSRKVCVYNISSMLLSARRPSADTADTTQQRDLSVGAVGVRRSRDPRHRSAVDAVMNSSGVIRGNASGSGEDSRSRSAVYSLRMGGTTLMLTLFAISPVPSTNEGVHCSSSPMPTQNVSWNRSNLKEHCYLHKDVESERLAEAVEFEQNSSTATTTDSDQARFLYFDTAYWWKTGPNNEGTGAPDMSASGSGTRIMEHRAADQSAVGAHVESRNVGGRKSLCLNPGDYSS